MDGTLVNTSKIDIETFNQVLNNSVKNIQEYFGPSTYDIFKTLNSEGRVNINPKILTKIWHDVYRKEIAGKTLLKKETITTLRYLRKKGYMLGIITGSDKYIVNITLKQNTKLFDIIITSDDYNLPKPDKESMLIVVNKLKLPKSAIVYVGDNYKDIIFAKNSGVKSIAKLDLLYGKNKLKSYSPDAIITKICELKKFF